MKIVLLICYLILPLNIQIIYNVIYPTLYYLSGTFLKRKTTVQFDHGIH